MRDERYQNIVLHGQIEAARPKGRLKKKWIDNTLEDCSDMGLTVIKAN